MCLNIEYSNGIGSIQILQIKAHNTNAEQVQLSKLVPLDSPQAILDEALAIVDLISPGFKTTRLASTFSRAESLYQGTFPGYQACNTEYHDFNHVCGVFLATARLLHGAGLENNSFSGRQIVLALISALLHDSWYIQETHDTEGTGSKYTANHVQRSMDFLSCHGESFGFSAKDITDSNAIMLCTDLSFDISTIAFSSERIELLGKILGSADLLAQMADRTYLEKLLFLYYEFKEAGFGDYQSELDLLRKATGFYKSISQRLEKTLDATNRFMLSHFNSRWKIKADLYHEAIVRQMDYLKDILKKQDTDPRFYLKRDGIVDKVRSKYQEEDSYEEAAGLNLAQDNPN